MTDKIIFFCHWDKTLECKYGFMCGGCESQPKDEDKPNYHNEPKKATKYSYGMPMCPSCGEPPYSNKRCIFCGQALIISEETESSVEITGGHIDDNENIICDVCGGNKFKLAYHSDGKDFYSFGYRCKCGNVVTEKYSRR